MAKAKFDELIDWASDESGHSLNQILFRAKVIAAQLRSRKFGKWLDSELNGYATTDEIPGYRKLRIGIYGNYNGPASRVTDVPMSLDHLDEGLHDIREDFQGYSVIQKVAEVEVLAHSESNFFDVDLGAWALNFLRQYGLKASGHILNQAYKRIPRQCFVGVLSSVRSRLLDFLLELKKEHPEFANDSSPAGTVSETDIEKTFDRVVYKDCFVQYGGDSMRDIYQVGQAGVVGPQATAGSVNFFQVLRSSLGDSSLAELADQLGQLRGAMLAESKSEAQDEAVNAVATAEEAAKKGDSAGVLSKLKLAGKWAADIATKIGTSLALKAIESAMQLP